MYENVLAVKTKIMKKLNHQLNKAAYDEQNLYVSGILILMFNFFVPFKVTFDKD